MRTPSFLVGLILLVGLAACSTTSTTAATSTVPSTREPDTTGPPAVGVAELHRRLVASGIECAGLEIAPVAQGGASEQGTCSVGDELVVLLAINDSARWWEFTEAACEADIYRPGEEVAVGDGWIVVTNFNLETTARQVAPALGGVAKRMCA